MGSSTCRSPVLSICWSADPIAAVGPFGRVQSGRRLPGAVTDPGDELAGHASRMQRQAPTAAILCLFNFSEHWQHLSGGWLRDHGVTRFHDALSDVQVHLHDDQLALPPFARVWLT